MINKISKLAPIIWSLQPSIKEKKICVVVVVVAELELVNWIWIIHSHWKSLLAYERKINSWLSDFQILRILKSCFHKNSSLRRHFDHQVLIHLSWLCSLYRPVDGNNFTWTSLEMLEIFCKCSLNLSGICLSLFLVFIETIHWEVSSNLL